MKPPDALPVADIGLFVEGTYPYVTGGVSSWLHQLVTHLPQYTFAICHLASNEQSDRTPKYTLPANVTAFQEVFLNSPPRFNPWTHRRKADSSWRRIERLHEASAHGDIDSASATLETISKPAQCPLDAADMLFSEEAWALLVNQYSAHARQTPFLNYFWTFR